jgi:hypothetical protein
MPIIRRTRLFNAAYGVFLVVLAVVVWSWDASCVTTFTQCTQLASQLHTTTASTTRKTPYAALNSLVLLMMGIMMPETC